MNFLSMILPGIREFRVPFTVGAMWLLAIAIVEYSHPTLGNNPGLHRLAEGYLDLPLSVQAAILSGAAYATGIIAHRLARDTSTALGTRFRRAIIQKADERNAKRRYERMYLLWTWVFPSYFGTAPLYSKIIARTFTGEEEQDIEQWIDSELFSQEESLAAMRFEENKPEQFQTYDRIVSEAEFKSGIALPTFFLAIAIGIAATGPAPLLICLGVGFASGLYLAGQGHRQHAEAYRHLLTAMSLGWTNIPTLEALREKFVSLEETRPKTSGQRLRFEKALTAVETVAQALTLGARRTYVSKLLHPSRSQIWRDVDDDQQQRYFQLIEKYRMSDLERLQARFASQAESEALQGEET